MCSISANPCCAMWPPYTPVLRTSYTVYVHCTHCKALYLHHMGRYRLGHSITVQSWACFQMVGYITIRRYCTDGETTLMGHFIYMASENALIGILILDYICTHFLIWLHQTSAQLFIVGKLGPGQTTCTPTHVAHQPQQNAYRAFWGITYVRVHIVTLHVHVHVSVHIVTLLTLDVHALWGLR